VPLFVDLRRRYKVGGQELHEAYTRLQATLAHGDTNARSTININDRYRAHGKGEGYLSNDLSRIILTSE